MLGKRSEHKHRSVEGNPGDGSDAALDSDEDLELMTALENLGRGTFVPRGKAEPVSETTETTETTETQDTEATIDAPVDDAPADDLRQVDAPADDLLEDNVDRDEDVTAAEIVDAASSEHESSDGPDDAADRRDAELADAKSQIALLTAELDRVRATNPFVELQAARDRADEFERSHVESQVRIESLTAELGEIQTGTDASDIAELRSAAERADRAERSFLEAQVRVASLTADLERARSETTAAAAGEVRTVAKRAESAEQTVMDLQSKLTTVTAELERVRSDAAAVEVALDRAKREAKDQEDDIEAAEEHAEQLAAEIEQLRAEVAKGPVQIERLRREAEREKALRAALDQAQASTARAEDVVADNLRLAGDLAANLKNQEALITALTGLQAELSEQRVWFESQISNLHQMEREQLSVVEALQRAVQDRDAELDALREQLLDAEAKRAEEAVAFIEALEK